MSVSNELVKLGMPAVLADYLADAIATGGDDEISARLAAVEAAVEAAEGDITTLDGRVTAAEGDITALDGRVTVLETPAGGE